MHVLLDKIILLNVIVCVVSVIQCCSLVSVLTICMVPLQFVIIYITTLLLQIAMRHHLLMELWVGLQGLEIDAVLQNITVVAPLHHI